MTVWANSVFCAGIVPSLSTTSIVVPPTNSPQFPNLFSAYATRPSWSAPGVDFYVGLPSSISLKSIGSSGQNFTAAISGATYAAAGFGAGFPLMTVTGSCQVIDSWDLSNTVLMVTGANVTVSNNQFLCAHSGGNAADNLVIRSTGIINVTCNDFNGGAITAGATQAYGNQNHSIYVEITNTNATTVTISCNYFHHGLNDFIDFVANTLGVMTVSNNLFFNYGTNGTHGDAIQTFSETLTNQTVAGLVILTNTAYTSSAWTGTTIGCSNNSFVRTGNNGTGVINNIEVGQLAAVYPSSGPPIANILQLVCDPPGPGLVNGWVHDIYVDDGDVVVSNVDPGYAGFFTGAVTNDAAANLFRMNTNGTWNLGQFSGVPSAGAPATVPTSAVITSATVSSGSAVLVGTSSASGLQISIFLNEQNRLTTTSSTGGAWTLTSSALASGNYSITARSVDSFANASPESNAKNITV